jgi:tRNA1Val (adenine37-N6)-methyltransferase
MKRTQDFHFKQFSIQHDKVTHKVGTDGVLLGAWVDVSGVKRVLDIGTGSGIIALMIAQRTAATVLIDGVELQKMDATQASENAVRSPWADRVRIHNSPIEDFEPSHQYDLMVSNPPFFVNSTSPPNRERGIARHTKELTFENLFSVTEKLLKHGGRIAVILPAEESKTFCSMAICSGYFIIRTLHVKSRQDKPVERVLMEFSKVERAQLIETLIIHGGGNEWSESYQKLTRDFYLKI